jgi:hypothetical protein
MYALVDSPGCGAACAAEITKLRLEHPWRAAGLGGLALALSAVWCMMGTPDAAVKQLPALLSTVGLFAGLMSLWSP